MKNLLELATQQIQDSSFRNVRLYQTIHRHVSDIPNCVSIITSDHKEMGFVFSSDTNQQPNLLQLTSFNLTISLLPQAAKIVVQPSDRVPKYHRITSQILYIIEEMNKSAVKGNVPNATLFWNQNQRQLSAIAYVTTSNFVQNDFGKVGNQIREHVVKELTQKIRYVWLMMDKINLEKIHQKQSHSKRIHQNIHTQAGLKTLKNQSPTLYSLELLKFYFEETRKERPNSTGNKIDLNQLKVHTIRQYLQIIQQAKRANNFYQTNKNLKLEAKISPNSAKNFFLKLLTSYKQAQNIKRQKSQKGIQQICRCISLCNTPERTSLESQGSFSETYFLKNCQYIVKFSLYDNSIVQVTKKYGNQPQETKRCDHLIQKKPLSDCVESQASFKIEKYAIFLMRGESCPSIAQYYMQKVNEGLSNIKEIYCQFYEGNPKNILNETNCKRQIKKILFFLKGLAEGIAFLSENNLIHRDLKPDNIRLDKSNFPKIIDFGSATAIYGSPLEQNTPKSSLNAQRFTRGYFLEYFKLPEYVTNIFSCQAYQRHKFFDVYSFGVIMGKFFSEGFLNGDGMSERFSEKIRLLESKCMEPNPADRLAPIEIVLYLEMLIKAWKQMCGP